METSYTPLQHGSSGAPVAGERLVPRLVATSLLTVLLYGFATEAIAADFGTPPSGPYRILFNDHTVYARPNLLKAKRVFAALAKDGQIFVPLRSMFEQMGAVVTVSPDGKTITAVKSDARVSVTLGKSEAMIQGETRPLDAPPMLHRGIVLVPVRFLSEALGAYVEWIPERHIVVVRYNPALPPPIVPPTPIPTVAPTAAPPIPTATPTPSEHAHRSNRSFIEGALWGPQNYNEFAAGEFCRHSYIADGAYALKNSPLALKVDFRQAAYVTSDTLTDRNGNHFTSFANIEGGSTLTPVFLGRQSSLDGRVEYQIADPRISVGVGYLHTSTNYGYPRLNAVGAGIEKLPDFRPGINLFGSAFYYPTASGDYTVTDAASSNVGKIYRQEYTIVKYDLGAALVWEHSPAYLYGGFNGDRYRAKQNAPVDQTHDGPYIGLGVTL